MKLGFVLASSLAIVSQVSAAYISDIIPQPTAPPHRLDKRYKDVLISPQYKAEQDAKKGEAKSKDAAPKPWLRTYSETVVEKVTPTVIGGVTFNAKPPKTTNGLEPWVSLNKNGSPKTIKPQNKGGHIKNAYPTYGTWFATATTKVYNKEEAKAHNMEDDEIFEEVIYIDEDPLEHSLSPLIRCTPDFYTNKGLAKNKKTEPFCFPHDGQSLLVDQTYFITWYSNFFRAEVENVRLHFSYVKESIYHKGTKRELEEEEDTAKSNVKRSAVIDKGGSLDGSPFLTTDWIKKSQGWFPVTVDEEWIGEKEYYRKVLVTIQPDNVADEDFDLMENFIVVEMGKGSKVNKETLVDIKKWEEKHSGDPNVPIEVVDGIDEKYYVMIAMPTVVIVAALLMYFFVFINKGYTDLSHLKKRKFARANTTKKKLVFKRKNREYSELPQFSNDIELTKND